MNDVWAMDFVHDQLALGKRLRILTIVDTHSRLCPAADPRFRCRGKDVVQTLERVCGRIGSLSPPRPRSGRASFHCSVKHFRTVTLTGITSSIPKLKSKTRSIVPPQCAPY